jgi:hypothetical protein
MGGTSMVGTLLGPEGSDGALSRVCGWFRPAVGAGEGFGFWFLGGPGRLAGIPLPGVGVGVCVGMVSGLLFENCIVDASIF